MYLPPHSNLCFFYVTLGFKPFNVKPFSSSAICFSAFLRNADFILALFSKSKSPVLLFVFVFVFCIFSTQHQVQNYSLQKINFVPLSKIVYNRKIPKISPGAYIFQRPILRGLFLEGLMYRGKFEFQNRLGQPYSWKEIYRFSLFYFVFEGSVQEQAPPRGGGACIWRGLYMEGLIFGILRYDSKKIDTAQILY